MTNIETIQNAIIEIRNQKVLLDSQVAEFYGVETKYINRAVSNNPHKFPEGYVVQLDRKEKNELVQNLHQFKNLKHSSVMPKAFTEKGLYMLATILKSQKATETTLTIIEAFAKLRDLQNDFNDILRLEDEEKKNAIGAKFGKNLLDMFLNDGLENQESEMKIKFNMFGFSLEKSVKKSK